MGLTLLGFLAVAICFVACGIAAFIGAYTPTNADGEHTGGAWMVLGIMGMIVSGLVAGNMLGALL